MTENKSQSMVPEYVAESILWLRPQGGTTPMHVLKLVYLCHGWMLGIHGTALINEPIEAWTYGPVVPTIYQRYKSFGGEVISGERIDRKEKFCGDQWSIITGVIDAYKKHSALELSNITHKQNTPWDIVRREYGIGSIIPNELIQDHYHKLATNDG